MAGATREPGLAGKARNVQRRESRIKRSWSDSVVGWNAKDGVRGAGCFCQPWLSACARWKGARSAGNETQREQRGNYADPETAVYLLNAHGTVRVKRMTDLTRYAHSRASALTLRRAAPLRCKGNPAFDAFALLMLNKCLAIEHGCRGYAILQM